MAERIALVTGAAAGIGLATAVELARSGVEVAVLARSKDRAQEACDAIAQRSGRACIAAFAADLSSQTETRAVAGEIRRALPRLDILVNNAGAIFSKRTLSVDGIEMSLATNYLGGCVLTQELLPLLQATPGAHVVNLSSALHRVGRIRFHDASFERWYYVVSAYAQSKLAVVISTLSWAERAQDVTFSCIDPGLARTGIGRGASNRAEQWAWRSVARLGRPVEETGKEVAVLASTCTATGGYFVRGKAVRPSRRARDPRTQARLAELTTRLTHA